MADLERKEGQAAGAERGRDAGEVVLMGMLCLQGNLGPPGEVPADFFEAAPAAGAGGADEGEGGGGGAGAES